ncbi:MAG: ABC transporter ATP-binding protein [Halodesulfurarchaeum sp.]
MTALDLEDVSKRFGTETALDSVSLSVDPGEFFTLVGPSGCGKTTTLRIVAGLTDPDTGTIRFGGESMAAVPPEDRNVGIVFQNYALFPHMSVAQNVAYGLRFHDPPSGGTVDDRVAELLDLVDLPDSGDRDPETLSGGQRQRVALARALAPGPELLLLDEPMSALDARLRDRLRRTVREIQSELSITTLYVTHDQAEALSVSDRLAVMRAGRIEQVGPPEQVYSAPRNRFVAGFVGENNLFEVRAVEGSTATLAPGIEVPLEGGESTVLAGLRPGISVAVRPEALHLISGPDRGSGPTARSGVRQTGGGTDAGVATFEATVEDAAFHGGRYTLTCRVGDRELLVDAKRAPEGTVRIGFSPADVQVLEGEGSDR